MIRYYGVYGRYRESDKYLHQVVSKEKHQLLRTFNRWRESLMFSFGYNPLECSICGSTMRFDKLYFRNKSVSLHELYEKVMAKAHGCRSPNQKTTSQFALSVVKSS
ncbi:MAG: hypothetical protein FWE25_06650 [Lachnospiraceae bacterium]|nr:hypothetical protein [Lachnospiraceae bacterium]